MACVKVSVSYRCVFTEVVLEELGCINVIVEFLIYERKSQKVTFWNWIMSVDDLKLLLHHGENVLHLYVGVGRGGGWKDVVGVCSGG